LLSKVLDLQNEREPAHVTFPLSLKLNERVAAAFSHHPRQERRQADQKDEPQSIFLTKLLPANRISAETPGRLRPKGKER
jgi:hypothetical protein